MAGKTSLPLPEDHSPFIQLRKKIGLLFKYLGPAFIVSVAYIDPGNFATNISGGSLFNYSLLWVILWSNIMAIVCQTLSAKLGIATDRNLPEMCARLFSRNVNWFLWIIGVAASMATDLAEFLGGTLGLYLLFRIPMFYACILTGIMTFFLVYVEKYGQRVVEFTIAALVAVITSAYVIELVLTKPDWGAVASHTLIPALSNGQAVLIAAGMLGATVMPHVIYLHSQLVQCRNGDKSPEQKKRHLRLEKIDIILAMNIAFIINAAMVVVSAAVFHRHGLVVETIEQAHRSLAPLVGGLSSTAFGIALLASGLSSSAVGTMAGQTIMKGFVDIDIPLNRRRFLTMAPGIVIIAAGVNPMKALLLSQVCLSFALPAAIIPMIIITSRKDLMGNFVNGPWTKIFSWLIAGVILFLNALLLGLVTMGRV
ncbi:MAG: Nramp family divalent metal transporter [Bacillota bacterium]